MSRTVLALVAGALLPLSMAPFHFWPIGPLALGLYFWVLLATPRRGLLALSLAQAQPVRLAIIDVLADGAPSGPQTMGQRLDRVSPEPTGTSHHSSQVGVYSIPNCNSAIHKLLYTSIVVYKL